MLPDVSARKRPSQPSVAEGDMAGLDVFLYLFVCITGTLENGLAAGGNRTMSVLSDAVFMPFQDG